MPSTQLPGGFVAVSRAMFLAAHPLLLPTEKGPGREWQCPQQQLWGLWETRAPGAALLGRWEALSQELLQVQQLLKAGAQPWGTQRDSLVLWDWREWCGTFYSEWRQSRLALDLCVRETVSTGLFSSTPFLLQAVLSAAVLWCLRNVHTGSAHCQCGGFTLLWLVELCLQAQLCVSQHSGGCFLRVLYPQVQAVLELASSWKLQSWA